MSQTIGDQAWSSFGKKFLQNSWQVCGLFMAFESEKSRRPVQMILSLRMLPGPLLLFVLGLPPASELQGICSEADQTGGFSGRTASSSPPCLQVSLLSLQRTINGRCLGEACSFTAALLNPFYFRIVEEPGFFNCVVSNCGTST